MEARGREVVEGWTADDRPKTLGRLLGKTTSKPVRTSVRMWEAAVVCGEEEEEEEEERVGGGGRGGYLSRRC